jgi:hypothetical protein
MTAHEYDKPVINLHELTNGLMKYYSPTFNQEVLGKPNDGRPWGYYQSLSEITDLLESVDHYKTSRLAHYHILNRQDTISEQVPFYNYLNDNFFIISARRKNVFEHALSWCIQNHSKKLNVYSHGEKIHTFAELYKNGINVDPESMVTCLFKYKEYLQWVKNHFHVNSYFEYDNDMNRLEDYILNLSLFKNQHKKKTWKEIFQIEFDEWNRCHYLISDLSGVGLQLEKKSQLKLTYEPSNSEHSLQLQSLNSSVIGQNLTLQDQNFLVQHHQNYKKASDAIHELVENKVLVTGVPIKLQTMLEKRLLVRNFDECVEKYNQYMTEDWSDLKGLGPVYEQEQINQICQDEIKNWHYLPQLEA